MALPEVNSTIVHDLTLSVSSLPLSVMVRSCHVYINLNRLCSGLPSRQCYALAVALHQCNSGLGILHGTKLSEEYLHALI